MKLLSFLLVILSSFALASEKDKKALTPFDKALDSVLTTVGVLDFRDEVKKIKSHSSVAKITELEYDLKFYFENIEYWYYFDADNYYSEMKYKMKLSLSQVELNEIDKLFQNPFLQKVLKSAILRRDIFEFHRHVLDADYTYPKLVKSRSALVKNVLLMFGGNLQVDDVRSELEEVIGSGKTLLTVISKNKNTKLFIKPRELQNRLDEVEQYVVRAFATNLADYKHYELREFLRLMKKSKAAQKYIQFHMNFHYFYFMKYINKIEEDKSNQFKALAIE